MRRRKRRRTRSKRRGSKERRGGAGVQMKQKEKVEDWKARDEEGRGKKAFPRSIEKDVRCVFQW